MSNTITRKQAQWRCYKPKKDGTGSASKLELKVVNSDVSKGDKTYNNRKVQVFWVAALQDGEDTDHNAKFGWQDINKSVTLKLGEPDIGELLSVLNGRKKEIGATGGRGLFHQNKIGNTSFTFSFNDKYGNYSLRLAKKVADKVTAVTHALTFAEAEILRILLERAVIQTYQW